MPTENNNSPVLKFARRHRHALMMGASAAIVMVSLGAFALLPPVQAVRSGFSLNPATPSQLMPPSSERNSPCGDVPAYQTPGSDACPGVSQNT